MLAAASFLIAGSACSTPPERSLTVFAAASLTAPFEELADTLESRQRGLQVQLSFAGSQQLATQIEHGAPADVFATANAAWMFYLSERQLVDESVAFASTDLVIVASSPLKFEDIAQPGMQIVVGAITVPIGAYTRSFLERLEGSVEFGPSFVNAIRANIVSEEDNVRAALAKVLVGEADAAFVYRSELPRLQRGGVYAVPIPLRYNVPAEFFVATVTAAANADDGRGFVNLLTSPEGRELLARHGFVTN